MDKEAIHTLLDNANWQYAKTMPENPHWYTLRKKWANDQDFVKTVIYIREYGKIEMYRARGYICYRYNGYKYWTMGCPLHDCSKTGTILINKKKI